MRVRRASWSHRDKTIVFWVAVAGVLVILVFVLPALFVGHTTTHPPPTPIGAAFAAGNARLSSCPAGASYANDGCTAGDFTYILTISASAVAFENVLFEVTNSSGTIVSLFSNGGFSIINWTGVVQASSTSGDHLAMTSTWNSYATWVTGSTPLTNSYDILIDMGVGNPTGAHLLFVAMGAGDYVDSTAGLPLP